MPLQNRVDPFGDIHAVAARGLFTGNRGIMHDPSTKTLLSRRWTNDAWIICTLKYKDAHREPMGGRNSRSGGIGWTELFFLDEVTALAAGHRPCFYCQRARAKQFLHCWGDAAGETEPKVGSLDERLHGERRASSGKPLPKITAKEIDSLPDGAMIAEGIKAYAVKNGRLLPWSFAGYGAPLRAAPTGDVELLTPPSNVAVLRAGYDPVWHPSADA